MAPRSSRPRFFLLARNATARICSTTHPRRARNSSAARSGVDGEAGSHPSGAEPPRRGCWRRRGRALTRHLLREERAPRRDRGGDAARRGRARSVIAMPYEAAAADVGWAACPGRSAKASPAVHARRRRGGRLFDVAAFRAAAHREQALRVGRRRPIAEAPAAARDLFDAGYWTGALAAVVALDEWVRILGAAAVPLVGVARRRRAWRCRLWLYADCPSPRSRCDGVGHLPAAPASRGCEAAPPARRPPACCPPMGVRGALGGDAMLEVTICVSSTSLSSSRLVLGRRSAAARAARAAAAAVGSGWRSAARRRRLDGRRRRMAAARRAQPRTAAPAAAATAAAIGTTQTATMARVAVETAVHAKGRRWRRRSSFHRADGREGTPHDAV